MASHPIDQSCSNCSAWINVGKDASKGLCKAHPPIPLFGANVGQPGSGTPELQFYFPSTAEFEWCREFALFEQGTGSP